MRAILERRDEFCSMKIYAKKSWNFLNNFFLLKIDINFVYMKNEWFDYLLLPLELWTFETFFLLNEWNYGLFWVATPVVTCKMSSDMQYKAWYIQNASLSFSLPLFCISTMCTSSHFCVTELKHIAHNIRTKGNQIN